MVFPRAAYPIMGILVLALLIWSYRERQKNFNNRTEITDEEMREIINEETSSAPWPTDGVETRDENHSGHEDLEVIAEEISSVSEATDEIETQDDDKEIMEEDTSLDLDQDIVDLGLQDLVAMGVIDEDELENEYLENEYKDRPVIYEAKQKLKRAIKILKQHRIPSTLAWLMENPLGNSDEVVLDESKDRKDFEKCKVVKRFHYSGNFYELFFENERTVPTPDWVSVMGDFRLIFNGEVNLLTSYSHIDGEWESRDEILFHDFSIDVIRINDWIHDLPKIVELEKACLKKIERKMQIEADQIIAKKIEESIDLGEFEEPTQPGKRGEALEFDAESLKGLRSPKK